MIKKESIARKESQGIRHFLYTTTKQTKPKKFKNSFVYDADI